MVSLSDTLYSIRNDKLQVKETIRLAQLLAIGFGVTGLGFVSHPKQILLRATDKVRPSKMLSIWNLGVYIALVTHSSLTTVAAILLIKYNNNSAHTCVLSRVNDNRKVTHSLGLVLVAGYVINVSIANSCHRMNNTLISTADRIVNLKL